jgi:hypothetical protein
MNGRNVIEAAALSQRSSKVRHSHLLHIILFFNGKNKGGTLVGWKIAERIKETPS